MRRYDVTQIVDAIFVGPIAVAIAIALTCVAAIAIAILVPAAAALVFAFIVAAIAFVFDTIIHPSLIKFWFILSFIAAAVLLRAWYLASGPELPDPTVRRGRDVESDHAARRRANDAVIRRRQALRQRRLH